VARLGFAFALLLLAGCMQPTTPPADEAPPSAAPVVREAIRFETGLGTFTVLLYPEAAPATVDLMKAYVAEGYYVGREFNRVVPGHVIQVIDKAGGASDDARRVPLEAPADHHFSAGAAGIARGADPHSGGPEIFFMDFGTSHLDGNYTVWGQLVDGLDVVHRIARVPTVDLTKVPGASDYLTDRQAVQAVAITATRLLTVELDAEAASHYPLQVAKNVRVDAWRHSLEWPNDLRAGQAADLTWYVRTSDDAKPAPAAPELQIRVGNETLAVEGDPDASGAYHWQWTPTAAGAHEASLLRGADVLATLTVRVGP
jgi:peptidylprolyl isomerase